MSIISSAYDSANARALLHNKGMQELANIITEIDEHYKDVFSASARNRLLKVIENQVSELQTIINKYDEATTTNSK
jgi:exonuclease V gamma subunit